MDVSDYKFSESEILNLQQYRDNQTDVRLRIRFIALLMLASGLELNVTASVVGKSIKTIENWHRQYVTKGIDRLNFFQYVPKKTLLTDEQIEQIVKWVTERNPGKIKEISQHIKEHFKISYSNEAVRKLLKRNGLKLLRPKVVPGNPPNEEEQKENIRKYFEMKSSCDPGTVFLFGDGMHLVHQNVPALCWGDPQKPPVIKTNTGRKRLNILGAYNPDTHSFVHLTGEEKLRCRASY
jgi:transposase